MLWNTLNTILNGWMLFIGQNNYITKYELDVIKMHTYYKIKFGEFK